MKDGAQPRQRVAGRGLRQRQMATSLGDRTKAVNRTQDAQQVEVQLSEIRIRVYPDYLFGECG
jgi:hypothetical protein